MLNKRDSKYNHIAIAPKRALTRQLTELEEQGIVEKTIYPVIPMKVEYHLTDAGKDLLPILDLLEKWGDKHKETFLNRLSINDE